MSYSKIPPLVLYIIIGITVLVMFIFFAADSFVNPDAYAKKMNRIENPSDMAADQSFIQGARTDSAAMAMETIAPVNNEPVQFSFMEKLAYYKTDIALYWGYLLLIIALVVAVTFPVTYLLRNPANLVRSLFILVGIAVLVGLAFLVASGSPIEIPGYTGTANTDQNTLKLIDAGLIFSYFMLGLAILSIFFAEVIKYFK